MTDKDRIKNLRAEIRTIELKQINEQNDLVTKFRNKMNYMINTTPTSPLRDDLTELNILFELTGGADF